MSRRLLALVLGPVILVVLGFWFFGSWGAVIGFFIGIAAVFFIPIFGMTANVLGITSLWSLLLVANAIPVGFWAINCLGRSCPNYSFAAASPQFLGASFCALIYWLFARPT
jgi:hypothetical protein